MNEIKIHRPQIQNFRKDNTSSKVDDTQFIPKQHKEFAVNLEAQFAKLMFNEMQKTVHSSAPSNTANDFYNSQLLNERSQTMAAKGGSKLQNMLLDEIYPKKFRNKANFDLYMQSQNKFNKHKIDMHDKPSLSDRITMGTKAE